MGELLRKQEVRQEVTTLLRFLPRKWAGGCAERVRKAAGLRGREGEGVRSAFLMCGAVTASAGRKYLVS